MTHENMRKHDNGTVCEMFPHQLPQIMMIERQSAQDQSNKKNGGVIPWSEDKFLFYMKKRRTCACWTLRYSMQIIGFCVIREYEILNIAIQRNKRRHGMGRSFIDFAKENSPSGSIFTMKVRESNLECLHFLKKNGFVARLPLLKEEYRNIKFPEKVEDGILMQWGGSVYPELTLQNRIDMFLP